MQPLQFWVLAKGILVFQAKGPLLRILIAGPRGDLSLPHPEAFC